MGKEVNIEKEFLKNVDRMLAGEEVKVGAAINDDYRTAVDFAQKLLSLRVVPSPSFKARLKERLLSKLSERDKNIKAAAETKGNWFREGLRRLVPQQMAWRALTTLLVVIVVAGGIAWGAGALRIAGQPPSPPSMKLAPLPPEPAPPPLPPGMKESVDSADGDELRVGGGEYDRGAIDRKIVRTGHLTLEVGDIAESMDEVSGIANDLGGYVLSSDKSEYKDRTSGRVSIRVPVEHFDEAFERLRQLAVDVPYESTESQDVTEKYTDLEAQLRNLEATEAQYLALLEKAETVEDILKVHRELSNVRGEIERIKGRMQYLECTSDMSLVEVNLQETKPLGTTGWSALETFKSAAHGLITFGRVLADIAIWLGIFCWIWIPILIFLLRRRRRKAETQNS